jgi:plasmid stabilization system protein ParE
MAELIWSDHALVELEGISDYIALDSRLYAQYTIQNIFKAAERLQTFPESGRHLPEFPNLPHRELLIGNYRIIYRYTAEENSVKVITVVHGSRLLKETHLAE